jgi:chaperonin GroES
MKKNLQAKNDRVIIKPVDMTENMYGNIIVPDLGSERPEIGEVISVGPGRTSEFGGWIQPSSNVGDLVMVPRIGTIRVEFESEEYYIVPDKEILATILEVTE